MTEKAIIAKNISKKFKMGIKKHQGLLARVLDFFSGREQKKEVEVLKDVYLELRVGEIVGIIGKNGSGKSTLLRIIAGIYNQDTGTIEARGKIISLINLSAGLKDRLTMRDNIFLVGALFDLNNRQIKEKFNQIVKFSELGDFVDTKLYQFSQGMLQRLAFATAIHSNPDILLLDEVFEVGDENFRRKSADKIRELVGSGISVILVSHELDIIEKYCNRVALVDKGKILRIGDPKETIKEYSFYE